MYRGVAAGVIAAVLLAVPAHVQAAECELRDAGQAKAQSVTAGGTVLLRDGREIRLAGIVWPEHRELAGSEAYWALNTLLKDRELALFTLVADAPETDRYGRPVLALAIKDSPAELAHTVQYLLVSQGHARVAPRSLDRGCIAALLAAEKAARAAGLGLWADPYYVMKRVEDPAGILAVRGRFAVVEGKVDSVRESGGTIYVNFGRRWSDDFTVTILKRHERSFTAAGLELKKLAGRQIRVRGTVEERGGPWIEAMVPGQIEIAERP